MYLANGFTGCCCICALALNFRIGSRSGLIGYFTSSLALLSKKSTFYDGWQTLAASFSSNSGASLTFVSCLGISMLIVCSEHMCWMSVLSQEPCRAFFKVVRNGLLIVDKVVFFRVVCCFLLSGRMILIFDSAACSASSLRLYIIISFFYRLSVISKRCCSNCSLTSSARIRALRWRICFISGSFLAARGFSVWASVARRLCWRTTGTFGTAMFNSRI